MEKKSERIEKENVLRFLERLAEASKGKKGAKLYGEIRRLVSRPKRQRVAVNVGKIGRCAKADDRVIVPGKVLGSGEIGKRISLCAVEYSGQALQKLKKAGCSTVGIEEILKDGKARLIT